MLALLSVTLSVRAATVSGGNMIINLDRDALAAAIALDATPAPSMYLEEFFDAQAANSRTFSQILEDHIVPGVAEIPATNLSFAVNGSQVSNLTGRFGKPTTIDFDPAHFESSVSGAIGLAGVLRYRIDIDSTHNRILSGDYTLEYDANKVDAGSGRSGWTLYNHVSFVAESFNLFNVVMDLANGSLILTGDLGLGEGYDHLSGSRGALVGDFRLETAVVPLPPALGLFASGLLALGMRRFTKGERG